MPLFFVLPFLIFSFTDGILKENPQICQIIKEIDKNAVRDMRKMSKHFGVSHKKTIFAYAKIGEEGPNASTTILHDRRTNFDLVKSGKFNPQRSQKVWTSQSCTLMEGTDCFSMFVTSGISRTLLGKCRELDCVLHLFVIRSFFILNFKLYNYEYEHRLPILRM